MDGNSRIQLPNQVKVRTQFQSGPNADPISVQLKSPDGIHTMVTGGETKVERHAVALLAGMLANSAVLLGNETRNELVDTAVKLAERVQVVLGERAEAKSDG